MEKNSADQSASRSVSGWSDNFLPRLGRAAIVRLLPRFKELSEDEIASEHSLSLKVAGSGVLYFGLGCLLLVVFLISLFSGRSVDLPLWLSIGCFIAAALLTYQAYTRIKVAMEVRERTASEIAGNTSGDATYRDVERIRSQRARLEETLFRRNLKDEFVLVNFSWQNISFFEDGDYQFSPRVNVLLGRNGYGKTLLLRTLVAMMQRDGPHSELLFVAGRTPTADAGGPEPLLRVEVTRNGDTEEIVRDATYFDDSYGKRVGKIPMLAIPDSRFLNRTRRTVAGAASTSEPLVSSGAHYYLTQEPYEGVVQDLLTQLCLDYWEKGGGKVRFERRIFRLAEEIIGELMDDREFRFAEIRRVGTSGFEILVNTGGTQGAAIPIQSASQGTLSIVAIFGLIHSFLRTSWPELDEDEACNAAGIVLIDEIDAHLHPRWQQKIMALLTRTFPNVQFIVSGHSPLIVAGCDAGEVSVLRRRPDRGKFYVHPMTTDFLGAKAEDLYKDVFEIEEMDRLYLEYTARTTKESEERDRDIRKLQEKEKRSAREEKRLNDLLRESRLTSRANQKREQRLKLETTGAIREREQSELEEQRSLIKDLQDDQKQLRRHLKEKDAEIEVLKQQLDRPAAEK